MLFDQTQQLLSFPIGHQIRPLVGATSPFIHILALALIPAFTQELKGNRKVHNATHPQSGAVKSIRTGAVGKKAFDLKKFENYL